MIKSNQKLNFLAQCAVFTMSPLIVPSTLCFFLLIFASFDATVLGIFSIPLVFSMILSIFPAMLIGGLSAVIRNVLRFKNNMLNTILWMITIIFISMWINAKFMSGITVHLVNTAYIMGVVFAIIACALTLLIEMFSSRIVLSRYFI